MKPQTNLSDTFPIPTPGLRREDLDVHCVCGRTNVSCSSRKNTNIFHRLLAEKQYSLILFLDPVRSVMLQLDSSVVIRCSLSVLRSAGWDSEFIRSSKSCPNFPSASPQQGAPPRNCTVPTATQLDRIVQGMRLSELPPSADAGALVWGMEGKNSNLSTSWPTTATTISKTKRIASDLPRARTWNLLMDSGTVVGTVIVVRRPTIELAGQCCEALLWAC